MRLCSTPFRFRLAARLLSAGLALTAVACTTTGSSESDTASGSRSAINAPTGSKEKFCAAAAGVQIYQCAYDLATGKPWSLVGPEAELTTDDGAKIHHFADANGVYWQSINDQSKVKIVSKIPEAHPGSIPWLLLKVQPVAGSPHPAGSLLGDVGYIRRVDTVGGLAPATACRVNDPKQSVAYTATYCFYHQGGR